jgi:hypothetical protein
MAKIAKQISYADKVRKLPDDDPGHGTTDVFRAVDANEIKAVVNDTATNAAEAYNLCIDLYQGMHPVKATGGYYTCSTGAAVTEKAVTIPDFVLDNYARFLIKFDAANTADNVTLNISGTGAKTFMYNGNRVSATNSWKAGEVLDLYFDGTDYQASNFQVSNDSSTAWILDYNTDAATTRRQITEDKRKQGLQISYRMPDGVWIVEMYTGTGFSDSAWSNDDNWSKLAMGNWKDFGSLAAGTESFIIVDNAIGSPTAGYYTLESAISAIVNYAESSGIDYRKPGLVISYKIEDNKVETKQFNGQITDFTSLDLWHDFGGADSIIANDEPAENGKDAFSTGGAYNQLIENWQINDLPPETEWAEVVAKITEEQRLRIVGLARNGQPCTEELTFPALTGGGSGGASTSVSINVKNSPLYAKAGGSVIIEAAIRSVTVNGSNETTNGITKLELIDRATGIVLQTTNVNVASSNSMQDFSFKIDVSKYFAKATQRQFRIRATDDTDITGVKNVNVIGVDVTCTSMQTLNYTESTALAVNGLAKSISMYKFANNASDKGILVKADILIDGTWQPLLGAEGQVITDQHTHNIVIDPVSLKLRHGSYAIRIYGEDVASGVTGNILYTSVFCIDNTSTVPLVAARWSVDNIDNSNTSIDWFARNGSIKLYETMTMDVAAYVSNASAVQLAVKMLVNNGTQVTTSDVLSSPLSALRSETYTISKKIQGFNSNGTVTLSFFGQAGTQVTPYNNTMRITGSIIAVGMVEGEVLAMEFQSRSNSDADKSITYNSSDGNIYKLELDGANYSTNGFVKDSFGTPDYGLETDKGIMALRIAEDVKGSLNFMPYNHNEIETTGSAFHISFMAKNIENDNAVLAHCLHPTIGMGFYITGSEIVFTTDGAGWTMNDDGTMNFGTIENGEGQVVPRVPVVASTIRTAYKAGERCDIDIVVEPTGIAPYSGIGTVCMYLNGELVGACYYNAGSLRSGQTPVSFDGTHGDLYIYNIYAWRVYFNFEQAFNNYLLMIPDTEAMITEYNFNNVMGQVSAEQTTKNRPLFDKLIDAGIMCFVVTKNPDQPGLTTVDEAGYPQNYPENLETPTYKGDKKTSRILDWYCYFPDRPWQNCKLEAVPTTNQGTTSAQRPIRNIRCKIKKSKAANPVQLLYTREQISEMFNGDEAILAKYDEAAANAAKKTIQIKENSLPTDVVTVKVDYSESDGANNGGFMQMYNELQVALGSNYTTPAQQAYTGPYNLYTSIASVPCGYFRTDRYSNDATDPGQGYFHVKGNFNEDKSDAKVFGFEGVPGYNKDCLNYGDFYEIVAPRDKDFEVFCAEQLQDTATWDALMDNDSNTGNKRFDIVMLSEFCGPKYNFYRRQSDSSWLKTTGTMVYNPTQSKWIVTGDVLNPVDNFELKVYQGLCWFQGVKSVDDMVKLGSNNLPNWLTYFESRYPDNDALNALYEDGKKVPYTLYSWLRFCDDCDYAQNTGTIQLDGATVTGTKENRLLKWKHELWKHANVHSALCYHAATDYMAAVDQRSKNMMIGTYLERDGSVRMYFNHLYDGDTILGADNDCGRTISAYIDPDTDTGIYQGYGSVLFKNIAAADYFWLNEYISDGDINDSSKVVTLKKVVNEMRNATLADGTKPFSYEGIRKYWLTDRLEKFQKLTSSFDGRRKYIEYSIAGDNYYYALHGLGLQLIPDFAERRFTFRDGYYNTGSLFSQSFGARCTCAPGTTVQVKLTAAKDGYFGISADRSNEATQTVYLKAGESATLDASAGNSGSGVMIYVFGADKIAELDISGVENEAYVTPSSSGWNINQLTLLRKFIIGGKDYHTVNNDNGYLDSLSLGSKPFLEYIDVRNTRVSSINATFCPRIETIYAGGSNLTTAQLAETSKITTFEVPMAMQELRFINIPLLTYNGLNGGTGLSSKGWPNVNAINIAGSPNINVGKMLVDVLNSQESNQKLYTVRISNQKLDGDGSELLKLIDRAVKGIDDTGATIDKPFIKAVYELRRILSTDNFAKIINGIEGIQILMTLEAFITWISEFNMEDPEGEAEVETVTLDNVDELAFKYYNGETYDEWEADYALENASIESLIY